MKKTLYFFLAIFFFAFSSNRSGAQTITSHWEWTDSTSCGLTHMTAGVTGCVSGLTMTAYYGDGTSSSAAVTCGSFSPTYVPLTHTYSSAGSYSVKFVLSSGSTPLDSVLFSHVNPFCATLPIGNYLDANSNCIFDAGEEINYPCQIQVDSAGVHIDTLYSLWSWNYAAFGPAGTVYQFKILTPPGSLTIACPSTGIITYTVPSPGTSVTPQYFGYTCTPTSPMDISLFASFWATPTGAQAYGSVFNSNCTPTAANVKIDFSPKYTFSAIYPAYPYTISGNSITINVGSVALAGPKNYCVYFAPVGSLVMGDTVHSTQTAYPIADANPSNNSVFAIDTIKISMDPNHKSVLPTGDITAGQQLQYMLEFENTGNDTAHNIHIMDTLSNYLDVNSIKLMGSTRAVAVVKYVAGGSNIIKFDFPNIMLADSSHKDANKGMVAFSINAKSTLTPGTVIPNRGGIYFDTNPVVMTNTAYSKIPVPVIGGVSAVSGKEILLYPNPVKNTLSITTEPGAFSSLSITNVLGQQVLSQDFSANVNVSSLPSGIYYITLKGNNDVTTMKFEKQ